MNTNPVTFREYASDNLPMLPVVAVSLVTMFCVSGAMTSPVAFATFYEASPIDFWTFYTISVFSVTGFLTSLLLLFYPLVLLMDRVLYGNPPK